MDGTSREVSELAILGASGERFAVVTWVEEAKYVLLDAGRVVVAKVVDPGNEYVEFCAKADALNSSALKRVTWVYMVLMLALFTLPGNEWTWPEEPQLLRNV